MAKSKKDAVNKSQAIRDALKAHPDKSPSEIAEALNSQGVKVNAQYVSTIKSNAKGKARKSVVKRKPGRAQNNGFGIVAAAVKFIREAGGIEEAKRALHTVEEIQHAMR
jgi:hypothetical protein